MPPDAAQAVRLRTAGETRPRLGMGTGGPVGSVPTGRGGKGWPRTALTGGPVAAWRRSTAAGVPAVGPDRTSPPAPSTNWPRAGHWTVCSGRCRPEPVSIGLRPPQRPRLRRRHLFPSPSPDQLRPLPHPSGAPRSARCARRRYGPRRLSAVSAVPGSCRADLPAPPCPLCRPTAQAHRSIRLPRHRHRAPVPWDGVPLRASVAGLGSGPVSP